MDFLRILLMLHFLLIVICISSCISIDDNQYLDGLSETTVNESFLQDESWTIVSIIANEPIDFNSDGVISKDIYSKSSIYSQLNECEALNLITFSNNQSCISLKNSSADSCAFNGDSTCEDYDLDTANNSLYILTPIAMLTDDGFLKLDDLIFLKGSADNQTKEFIGDTHISFQDDELSVYIIFKNINN